MRECFICAEPHRGLRRDSNGILYLGLVQPKRDTTRLDCGHREPDLIPHWQREEAAGRDERSPEAPTPLPYPRSA